MCWSSEDRDEDVVAVESLLSDVSYYEERVESAEADLAYVREALDDATADVVAFVAEHRGNDDVVSLIEAAGIAYDDAYTNGWDLADPESDDIALTESAYEDQGEAPTGRGFIGDAELVYGHA